MTLMVTIDYLVALRAAHALDDKAGEFAQMRARAIDRGDFKQSAACYQHVCAAREAARHLRSAPTFPEPGRTMSSGTTATTPEPGLSSARAKTSSTDARPAAVPSPSAPGTAAHSSWVDVLLADEARTSGHHVSASEHLNPDPLDRFSDEGNDPYQEGEEWL